MLYPQCSFADVSDDFLVFSFQPGQFPAAGSAEGAAIGRQRHRERSPQWFLMHIFHISCMDTGPIGCS